MARKLNPKYARAVKAFSLWLQRSTADITATPTELRNAARRARVDRVRPGGYDLAHRHRPCVGCGRLTRWIWLATFDHVCHTEACADMAALR